MNNLYAAYKRLLDAQEKLEAEIETITEMIKSRSEDDIKDISIFWQGGDGFVVEYESNNVPIERCLTIIHRDTILTLEKYMKELI